MPPDPLTRYRALHAAIRQGLVQAAHDLSEGGLAVAVAEMCLAGRLGARVELDPLLPGAGLTVVEALFAESNGRLLVEVAEGDAASFEAAMAGTSCAKIGTVQVAAEPVITAQSEGEQRTVLSVTVEELVAAWKGEVA